MAAILVSNDNIIHNGGCLTYLTPH